MKKFFTFLFLFIVSFYFSQQTEGLRMIKKKYDLELENLIVQYKQDIANKAYHKKLKEITRIKDNAVKELEIKRNAEYLEELLKIKTDEVNRVFDVSKLQVIDERGEIMPRYSKGNNVFKEELANNFYSEAVKGKGKISCELSFVIERDGSIVNVKGTGENESFNKQAELALYLIQDTWEPGRLDGRTVKCRMRVPLTLNLN